MLHTRTTPLGNVSPGVQVVCCTKQHCLKKTEALSAKYAAGAALSGIHEQYQCVGKRPSVLQHRAQGSWN